MAHLIIGHEANGKPVVACGSKDAYLDSGFYPGDATPTNVTCVGCKAHA